MHGRDLGARAERVTSSYSCVRMRVRSVAGDTNNMCSIRTYLQILIARVHAGRHTLQRTRLSCQTYSQGAALAVFRPPAV